jgi:hypothetical protein
MENGLNISENEFMKLPQKQQLCLLYKNQCTTLNLIESYKFHQKVQYVLISSCVGGVGVLFSILLGV